jgi:hypothetical protein
LLLFVVVAVVGDGAVGVTVALTGVGVISITVLNTLTASTDFECGAIRVKLAATDAADGSITVLDSVTFRRFAGGFCAIFCLGGGASGLLPRRKIENNKVRRALFKHANKKF